MTKLTRSELLEFYNLFLSEAGLAKDTPTKKAKRVLRKKIKRTRSEAAILGWKRRKRKIAKEKKEREERKLKAKRRRSYLKGLKTKKRNEALRKKEEKRKLREKEKAKKEKAKKEEREEKIKTGGVKAQTPAEKFALFYYELDPDIEPIIFSNADGSVDGEIAILVAEGEASDLLARYEDMLPAIPPATWVSIGMHFNMVVERDSPPLKTSLRPNEPIDKDLMRGGGTVYTNYRSSREIALAFLAAFEIIDDVEESEKTGFVYAISFRLAWNHGRRPA